MATTISFRDTLAVIECGMCNTWHAIPTALHTKALADGTVTWYCPMGHRIGYAGHDENTKLRKRLEREEARAARLLSRVDQAEAATKHEQARANGYKGALVKSKQRAARGVCPVAGCKRHFVDVERHVASKHPGFVATVEVDA